MTKTDVKYSEIEVKLVGQDGNAYAIIGAVIAAMKEADLSKEQIEEFLTEAMAGDYDHLLQTCMKYVNVS